MATLKSQIEHHIPFAIDPADTDKAISWLREVQYILVHIVEENDAQKFTQTFPVSTNGLDISAMRFLNPYKNGIRCGMYPQYVFPLMGNQDYKGIYSVSEKSPAAIIKDGKIYIFPDGGEIVSFGAVIPENLNESDIKGLPLPFQVACIYYVAIQFLKEYIFVKDEAKGQVSDEPVPSINVTFPTLTRETFAEVITLVNHPPAPADPSITADEASAPNVTSPTLNSPELQTGANGELYVKEDLNLVYEKVDGRSLDDDIEMLAGEIQILQKKVETANTRMNDELNRVNTLIQGFQSRVQHSLEQGRLTMTATNSQEQLKLNRELSNAQNKLTAAIEEKRLLFTKYQAEINSVIAENQNKISEFQQKVNVWAQKNDLNVTEFQVRSNEILTKYQTDINTQFQTHAAQVQKVATNAQITDSKIQTYYQSISLLMQQYTEAIQAYIRSVTRDPFIPAPADPEVQA